MENREIEAVLLEIARILDLKGENPFKVRAYENAARAIASLQEDAAALIRAGRLKVPGIGESISEKLKELVETGDLGYLDELREGIPPGLFELLEVQGLGPKKTRALWEQLGVTSLEQLEVACREGRVAALRGFGQKTQDKLVLGIALLAQTRGRRLRADALPEALRLRDTLRAAPGVEAVEIAGSLRRGRETVKDVDVLVAAREAEPVMERVAADPAVEGVIGRGPTKTSVRLGGGLQVDVRVVEPRSFACALAYFTGSKEFNVALRQLALEQGYSLNEYFLRPLDGSEPPALATEAALFAKLGLAYVEPELRENTGEIPAAQRGSLPALVRPDDLRGVLHVHTTWSDGAGSVDDMVRRAQELGYGYVGISDHSQAATYAHGLTPERLAAQREEVEAARARYPGIVVLHGVEADILPDGTIDLGDACLSRLDFVVASVHSELRMPRERMTARVARALEHPKVKVWGHPLGRRLLEREPSELDWEPLLDVCARRGVAVEVNGHPQRLDADWIRIRRIRARGVKLCLNPDAHAPDALDDARTGAVVEARRGWATRDDVVNALPADRFVTEFLGLPASRVPAGAAAPAPAPAAPAGGKGKSRRKRG